MSGFALTFGAIDENMKSYNIPIQSNTIIAHLPIGPEGF